MLTFEKFRIANLTRQKTDYKDCATSDLFLATALAGEVGELCNFIKKENRDNVDYKKEIAKEIADVLTYLDVLAAHYGFDLAEITINKFNEVSQRNGGSVFLSPSGNLMINKTDE